MIKNQSMYEVLSYYYSLRNYPGYIFRVMGVAVGETPRSDFVKAGVRLHH